MRLVWIVFACLLASSTALAHGTSRSYLTVDPPAADGGRAGRLDLAIADLAVTMPLDANGDHRVVWGEILAAEPDIVAMIRRQLRFSDAAGPCGMVVSPLMIDWHGEQAYVVVPMALHCRGDAATLAIDYRFMADIDASHRMLARVDATRTLVVTPGMSREIGSAHASPVAEFRRYLAEGAHHIWIGYDHLAFLCALLLPAVLRRRGPRWEPVPALRNAVLETVKIVSAFTVSHSITLGLAALGLLRPPAALVEMAIALSVAAAAALNFVPSLNIRGAWLAFGFGFIHGFGFANALADLGLSRGDVVIPLLGFNLGVEFGQLAVVAAVLPLLFIGRVRPGYSTRWLPAASGAIVLVALYWTVLRWPL